jgi:hypothetical protein
MAKPKIPSPEELRQLLRYDPETGKLFWRERPVCMFRAAPRKTAEAVSLTWNKRFAGREAFITDNGTGYRMGRIGGRAYLAHRVAWAIARGAWPDNEIDHINRDRADNRLSNLREVTRAENSKNKGMSAHNTSGANGVSWNRKIQKWQARIQIGRRTKNLGFFSDFNTAVAARKAADIRHGFNVK